MQDLRHAIRTLARNPGLTIPALLMLAFGIGGCAAIFTVLHGVLLRPLPYPEADRLVQLWELSNQGSRMSVPEANFVDWRARAAGFQFMAMYQSGLQPVLTGSEPARLRVTTVSSEFFDVLGVRPFMGRTWEREVNEPVAVVSYGLWQRVLGAPQNLEGQRLSWNGTTYTVVGVMPSGYAFPPGTEVWGPRLYSIQPFNPSRSGHNWSAIARVKAGVSLDAARREIGVIVKGLRAEHSGQDFTAVDGTAVGLREQLTQNVRVALPVLFGSVLILLLIACANVGNLLLAHGAARQRELGIRSALGAGRWSLVRLFVTQSLVLAVAGGVLGVLLAILGVEGLVALAEGSLPRREDVYVDGTVLAFVVGIAILVGVLLGGLPAMRASRNIHAVMKEGGRSQSQGRSQRRVRSALVVSQVALALMLLVSAVLLARSFLRIMDVQMGFQTANRLIADIQVSPPSGTTSSSDRSRIAGVYRELIDRIRSMPEVRAVGGTSQIPLSGRNANGRFLIEGGRHSEQYWPGHRVATPGYFEAMGIPLIRGRLFNASDGSESPHVAVISKAVADTVWPGQDAIGQRINTGNMDGDDRFMTVIGIVADVRQNSPEVAARGEIYVNYLQRGFIHTFTIAMEIGGGPDSLVPAIRSEIRRQEPNATVRFETLDQSVSSVLAPRRFNLLLLGVFGATALLLSLLGVYGLTAYSVAQRRQEVGVRMALGAKDSDVVRLFVLDGTRLVAVGIVVGVIGALALSRALTSLLFGVEATDWVSYAAAAIPLLAAAVVASHVPARRAARIDPLITLRG